MSNVKSAQIVMLIVAMLAHTMTAVPAQRLLFPQHWLAGWDMVDEWAAQPVQYNSTGRLPYTSTLDGEELPALYTTEETEARAKSWQRRAAMKIASVLLDASTD